MLRRKLTDALAAQIESGLIVPSENTTIKGELRLEAVPVYPYITDTEDQPEDYLLLFDELAKKFKLPTHNAVAFFTSALARERQLQDSEQKDFVMLMSLALAGRGFAFGTTFDLEQSSALRPCDLMQDATYSMDITAIPGLPSVKEEYQKKATDKILRNNSLMNQTRLKGAYSALQDAQICYNFCEKLCVQRELVANWKKLTDTPSEQKPSFMPSLRDIFEFWQIYKEYCINQLKYNAEYIGDWLPNESRNVSVASEENIPRIEAQLKDLEQTMILLIRLNHFYNKINSILKIKDRAAHLAEKQKWIQSFSRFLAKPDTVDAIEAAERCAPDAADETTAYFDGINDLISAVKLNISASVRSKRYPMLDAGSVQTNFNRHEASAIKAYQKHPMYRCYKMIMAELSKAGIAMIAPYYMAHWFTHKQAPKNPFMKKSYKLTEQNTKLNCDLTITEDGRVHYAQECNARFFQKLCQWYADVTQRHFEMTGHSQDLCDALYARCHSLVVRKDWLPVESRPYYKRWMPDDIIYQIYQKLDGIFDYGHFQTYAKSVCRAENMLYFFYEKQDSKIIKVKKCISKLIDSQTAEEYKKLAFLPEPGIGYSYMPLEWHQNLAKWLESIIRRDSIVEAYAAGDPDPFYPGSRVTLSKINNVYIASNDITPKEKLELSGGFPFEASIDQTIDHHIYPEDIQPYLSVVEWYIQKICSERIGDDMRSAVFGLYKRILLRT